MIPSFRPHYTQNCTIIISLCTELSHNYHLALNRTISSSNVSFFTVGLLYHYQKLCFAQSYISHAVICSCLPFIMSGQNHLARYSGRRKKTRQTEKEVGRQHEGMDRPGVRQVPEGSGEQGDMEGTAKSFVVPQRARG